MKKVLIIHNGYKIKGGEDTNFEDEIKFLKKNFEVESMLFDNSTKANIFDIAAFITGRNFQSDKRILNKIKIFNPDIVYIHNIWFKISFGLFKILEKSEIKTILKVHNYRYECSRHWLLKNHIGQNDFCNACALKNQNTRFFNKYFENSYIKSAVSIIFSRRYYKILKNSPISIAVISNFHKSILVDSGVNSEKVFLHRNPFNFTNGNEANYNSESNFIVYAGRLTHSKGVEELLDAWCRSSITDINLKIIGDGELKKPLQEKYLQSNIEFLGELELENTLELIGKSRAVVTATKMYEGQPRLLTEASFYSVPSLFPSFGGMIELFPYEYPLKFDQFNYSSLESKLNLLEDSNLLDELSISVKENINNLLGEDLLNNTFERMTNNE
jgi:glycosyltransferase involved in cell wall biosynthesis